MPSKTRSQRSYRLTPEGERRAERAIRFIEECCVHTIGKWAGLPFILTPWQRSFVREIFGRVDRRGMRITRRAFLAVARKQGKSELCAAIALYLLVADGEPSPQVYGAANDRDQASIIFDVAAAMVGRSPQLRKMAKVIPSTKRIICTSGPSAGGYYRAIPADAAGSHGFNASAIIFDEFHTQTKRDLYDVLSTSTSAREQPLILMITTAGFSKTGPCHEVYEYAKGVIDGTIEDKSFVARVFECPQGTSFETLADLDAKGNFTREKDLWVLANPSLLGQPGGFVRPDEIRRAVKEAIHLPRARNHILNLHFNIWTDAAEAWLDLESWDATAGLVDELKLKGRRFYGALDLSHVQDFTAWCLLFPPEDDSDDECFRAIWRFWMPEEALLRRGDMKPTLEQWVKAGFVRLTPGNVVDHREVEAQVLRDCETFQLDELAFDRFHAYPIVSSLNEALPEKLVDVGQSFRHLNSPAKELERLIAEKRIMHGGNPIMRWMVQKAVAETDRDDRIRPSRLKSGDKIDGIMALVMALEREIHADDHGDFVLYIAES